MCVESEGGQIFIFKMQGNSFLEVCHYFVKRVPLGHNRQVNALADGMHSPL